MKMMKLALIVLVAFCASHILADVSSGTCPGGRKNGEQFDEGRYWYECQDGQRIPKGCLDENNKRVDIDATYDTKTYRMQCIKDKDGYMTSLYKACMLNGAEHDVGAQWDDGTAFFTCIKEGNNVRVITLGCVDQGRPLKLAERVAKGDFIYQCRKNTDGTPKLNKVGCVYEGKKYNIGETLEGPQFWYTCTDSGVQIVGCMYQGHRLVSGDHFTKDDMMFSCKVNGDKTEFEPFACLQREESGASIERKVGCFWVEGQGSEAYEYTCKEQGSNSISKVQTQCVYRASEGNFKLQPGCVQLAGTVAVGCLQDSSSGKLKIQTYSADRIDSLPGLRQC
jgi:hypothetical protein